MRKDLCKDTNVCLDDGSLNLKYFNVKKGHYWSQEENEKLIKGVIKYGACSFLEIRKEFFADNWSETEIRLRICKLLRYYKITDYKDHNFSSEKEIFDEACKNRKEAEELDKKNPNKRDKHLVGGILFNPPTLEELNKTLIEQLGGVEPKHPGFQT